jgi:hypothetical protein
MSQGSLPVIALPILHPIFCSTQSLSAGICSCSSSPLSAASCDDVSELESDLFNSSVEVGESELSDVATSLLASVAGAVSTLAALPQAESASITEAAVMATKDLPLLCTLFASQF